MDASDVLRLEVRNFRGPARWDWALTNSAGVQLADHEVRLDPQSLEYKAMTRLQFYVRWQADPERPLESENEFLGRVGHWMGERVLGEVGRKLVEQQPATALVVVPPDAPPDAEDLRHWPLELAWVGGQPLALQEVSLVFGVPARNPGRRKEPIGERLRMLAVFSLPTQEPLLVLSQQRYELVRSIERVATSKGKSVDLLTLQYGVTRKRLREVLEEGEGWDVVHFSGHGLATQLLLERTGGEVDPVPTDELLDMLRLARSRLKLLVLSSCDSGAAAANEAMQARASQIGDARDEPDDSPPLPSLAVGAARQLDCAVLGMRYRVGDDFSIDLAHHLYDRLLGKGNLLPRALQLALPDALKHWPEPGNPPLSVATPALFGDRAVDLSLVPPEAEPNFVPRLKMSHFGPEPERFVGRVEPMAVASRALTTDDQVSGVLFCGPKLTGKTACAIELAYRYEDHFSRLVWYPVPTRDEPIAGTLIRLAEALETQLEGFGSEMKDAVGSRTELERFLPRLTKLMERYAILVAIDGIEALLTREGNWRDDMWRLVVNALLDHNRGSRLVLTSERLPTALHHRLSVVPVPALSPIEALLLARQLPHLGDLLRGRTELPMERAVPLLADTLAAASGLPGLIREADKKLSSSGVLDELPAHVADLARAAGPGDGTMARREEYLSLVRKWTRGIHRSSSAVASPEGSAPADGPFEPRGHHPQAVGASSPPPNYSGKVKTAVCRGLGESWRDLADHFEVPNYERRTWERGWEPQTLWEWLSERGRLGELSQGLESIGRGDLLSKLKAEGGVVIPFRAEGPGEGANTRFNLTIQAARGSREHGHHDLGVSVYPGHIVEPGPADLPVAPKQLKIRRRRRPNRPPQASLPSLPGEYIERPEQLARLRELVMDTDTLSCPVVALVGMGGSGKSVLASALGADPVVRARFPDVAWVAVGPQRGIAEAQHELAVQFGYPRPFGSNVEENRLRLAELLEDSTCLVILDDVWDEYAYGAFDALPPRGRLLITTRDIGLARRLGAQFMEVSELAFSQSLALLARWVRLDPQQLPPQADSLCVEVGHLALGVATVGALVAAGGGGPVWGPAWTDVLTRLIDSALDKVGAKFGNYQHATLLRAIDVSLDFLTAEERQRYHELAVIGTELPVPRSAVEALWAPTGLSSLDTGELLRTLAERSLLRLNEQQQISLHDLQRDVATYYLRKRPGGLAIGHAQLLNGYRQRIATQWTPPSVRTPYFTELSYQLATRPEKEALRRAVADGYLLDHLAGHLAAAGWRDQLHDLLVDFAWLELGLTMRSLTALLADYAQAFEDDSSIQDVYAALQLSAHVLDDRLMLPGQLLGRLLGNRDPALSSLLEAAATSRPGPWLRPRRPSLTPPGGPLLHTLIGHMGPVRSVALIHHGPLAITASEDCTARVWNLASGRCEHVLRGHEGPIGSVAVSGDGARAVTASDDRTLRVWNLASGRCEQVLKGHGKAVGSVAVSGDGARAVTASDDRTLRVWNLASGRCEYILEGHEGWVGAVAVSADGTHALSGASDRTARVWDLASGQCEKVLEGHTDRVLTVVVTADNTRALTGSEDCTARVWDIASGHGEHVLEGHEGWVEAVAVSRDGARAVTGSLDRTARVWDLASGRCEYVLGGHAELVGSVAVSADGTRAVTGSEDGTARVWDLASGHCEHVLRSHGAPVGSVALSTDGSRAVTGSIDGTARVWDLALKSFEKVVEGHADRVEAVAVSADGARAVTGSLDRTARVWDLTSGRCEHMLEGHEDSVRAVAVSADGSRAVTGSLDRTARVWDLTSGRCEHILEGHEGSVRAVAVSADGSRAVTGSSDCTARVWDLTSGRCEHVLKGHTDRVEAVAVSAHGSRAVTATAYDGTARVWDLASGRCEHVLKGHDRWVGTIAVSANGSRAVITCADHTAYVWDLALGRCEHVLKGHEEWVMSVATSADGSRAVTGAVDGTARVWDLASGRCEHVLKGHTDRVEAVAVSADGSRAVAASYDGTVLLWDLSDGQAIDRWVSDGGRFECLAASEALARIACGNSRGEVHIFDLGRSKPIV